MNPKRNPKNVLSPEQKLAVLGAAAVTRNVARTCREFLISRTSFYRIKKAYDAFGAQALVPKLRRKPRMPNAFPESVIEKVLEETRKHPQWSYVALGARLRSQGLVISNSGVRKIWERRGLTRRPERLLIAKGNASSLGGVVDLLPESPSSPEILPATGTGSST